MCDKCGCSGSGDEPSFAEKVSEIIDDIRPNLQSHGGDVELVGVDEDNTVRVRLQGACSGCPGATMTLKAGIERILKAKLPEVKQVIAVS
jgi:Fe-S cluster biogenesis protein NfuA